MNARPKRNIVVLGGGFGGVFSVIRLEQELRHDPSVNITLVSDQNFFLYTPFLHEVATGGIETRHIAYPLRRLRGKRHFNIQLGQVLDIDLKARRVTVSTGTLDYDYLVLALGSTTNMAELPGASSNIFTLKNLHDGIVLRNHVIRMFELADAETDTKIKKQLLTFVVVGAGHTGVQLVTELCSFVDHSLLKGYRRIDPAMVRVLLVDEASHVLSGEDMKLAAVALKHLHLQRVETRLNSRVTRIWDHGLELNHQEMETTETVVWAAGVVANSVVATLPVAKDEKGRVIVDQYLRLPEYHCVYALGDNAHFSDRKTGLVLPPRAHYAVRQPKTVATNIIGDLRGKPLRKYHFRKAAELVSLGPRNAVLNLYGLHMSGLPARFIWLVGYLSIMMGLYNRTRVLTDWMLNLIFGRDNTLLPIDRR
ncbi:MAG: NAD(P)/FAD-dependent oxidoreductase [Chloroflexi bacterium]|nr:NAD(P)/FAD-dependent oxidoreductase [Chloroflexota bacterium]